MKTGEKIRQKESKRKRENEVERIPEDGHMHTEQVQGRQLGRRNAVSVSLSS